MATDLETIFADAKVKAENASDIAYNWANGADTLEITTDNGPLPSLAKFMLENVSEASNTKLDIDLSTGNVTLSSADFVDNLFFRASGNTVSRTLTVPNIPKAFFVENLGTAALLVELGTTSIPIAPDNTILCYTDGTTNGLSNVLRSQPLDNYSATVDPGINDDSSQGYSVGSTWVNNTPSPVTTWVCINDSVGAAEWVQTSISITDLGDMATQDSTAVTITGGSIAGVTFSSSNTTITGGSISGITDLPIADGGTGASTASAAFNALKQAATDTTTGVVEKATLAEVNADTADKYPDASLIGQVYAKKDSPGLTGTPTTPTQTTGDNSTKIASTAYVRNELNNQFNVSGSAPKYACRAWVNFNGTGTVAIRASGNVSSITDNGGGDYTINFSTAMQDANYSIVGTVSDEGTSTSAIFQIDTDEGTVLFTTSARIQILNSSGAGIDSSIITAAVFR